MSQNTRKGTQNAPGTLPEALDDSGVNEGIQTSPRGHFDAANGTSDNKLIWLPPVEEDHGKVAHWHVWYSECKRYRVIRSQSLLGDNTVNFGATRGEKPYQILKAELNSLEKAVSICEMDLEKKYGSIGETNTYSMLTDAETKNLHSAKFTLPTSEDSGKVTSTGSTSELESKSKRKGTNMAATKTEKKVFHLSKTSAVELLQALDFKSVSEKTPIEKLEHHLNELSKSGADDTDVEKLRDADKDEEASTLEEILKTLKAKGCIEVRRPEGEEEAPFERNGTVHDSSEEEEDTKEETVVSYNPEPTETLVMNVDDLEFADYNPGHRTDPESSSMKSFAKQLRADGKIHEPILVYRNDSDKYVIIEGHRRATACKINGWPRIEVRVVEGDNPEAVYATVNANRKKHNGTETLEVFLGNKEAVPAKLSKKMQETAALVGKVMLRDLAKKGLSARTVTTAIKTCKYIDWMDEEGVPTKEQVIKVLKWMMAHDKLVGKVMRAITEKRPKQMAATAKTILEKVEANEPLDFEVK